MRKLFFLAAFFILFSCTESATEPTAPELPSTDFETRVPKQYQWECRNNMVEISAACMQWFCQFSSYPGSLVQLGEPFSSMACPECGLPYSVTGDQNGYTIVCPGNCGHGFILDSTPSWEPDITTGIHGCREIMRLVASQCIIFYATESRWPRDLDELGWGHLRCPACGEEFNYSLYPWNENGDYGFFISCPIPREPNHGYVIDGSPSW